MVYHLFMTTVCEFAHYKVFFSLFFFFFCQFLHSAGTCLTGIEDMGTWKIIFPLLFPWSKDLYVAKSITI